MIVIFHKRQPLGKLSIEKNTVNGKPQISIKRNDILLFEDDDYSLREIEKERKTTFIQDFDGQEVEVMTLITPPK